MGDHAGTLPGWETRTISDVPDIDGCVTDRQSRFDELFGSFSRDVAAYCSWRAGSPSDAQDAVADVFLAAWRRLDDVPAGEEARVWLYATARRVMANQRRSTRRRIALQDRLEHEAAAAAPARSDADRDSVVHEALERLGPRDREILLLAEWEGLSPAQIAVVMGCLTVTARGRLHRARRRFRTAYDAVRGSSSAAVDSVRSLRRIDERV
jgi:RNA polymerase sigma factor (sigma-70 family)